MNARTLFAVLVLAMLADTALADGMYRCTDANGNTVYTGQAYSGCSAIHIDPPPTDSLDNPEAAARYQMQQAYEAQLQQAQQQAQAERQRDLALQEVQRQQIQLQQQLIQQAQQQAAQAAAQEKAREKARRRPINCTTLGYNSGYGLSQGQTVCY